jgi:DNA polymerase alpha subunit A
MESGKNHVFTFLEDSRSLHLLSSSNCDISDVSIDASKLPFVTVDGRDILRIYWLDAFEDYLKQPGVVYLFGKVWVDTASAHVSCCLTVKNIEKRVFLLPRKFRFSRQTKSEDTSRPVSFTDVYEV